MINRVGPIDITRYVWEEKEEDSIFAEKEGNDNKNTLIENIVQKNSQKSSLKSSLVTNKIMYDFRNDRSDSSNSLISSSFFSTIYFFVVRFFFIALFLL
jgi:ATP-dependent Zn protease